MWKATTSYTRVAIEMRHEAGRVIRVCSMVIFIELDILVYCSIECEMFNINSK